MTGREPLFSCLSCHSGMNSQYVRETPPFADPCAIAPRPALPSSEPQRLTHGGKRASEQPPEQRYRGTVDAGCSLETQSYPSFVVRPWSGSVRVAREPDGQGYHRAGGWPS